MEKNKRIIIVSWKDFKNPQAGGAEIVQHEIAKRLVSEGHEVINLVPGFDVASETDTIDGVKIIRVGKSVLSFARLARYYQRVLRREDDILIDVFNCFGSFSFLFCKRAYILIHHIQGKIWLYEKKFPFVFPINFLGWFGEKLQLYLISRIFRNDVITISDSTRNELRSHGFKKNNIHVIAEGVDIPRAKNLGKKTNNRFKCFFIGRMVSMKRPVDAIRAFKQFSDRNPESEMFVAGDGGEVSKVLNYIKKNNLEQKVNYLGRISNDEKLRVMRESHVLLVTSVKEGWGLVVTEANSQGTPAVVYDTSGLRDSVKDNITGIICKKNDPMTMSLEIERLFKDKILYDKLRGKAYEDSASVSFDKCYEDVKKIIFY